MDLNLIIPMQSTLCKDLCQHRLLTRYGLCASDHIGLSIGLIIQSYNHTIIQSYVNVIPMTTPIVNEVILCFLAKRKSFVTQYIYIYFIVAPRQQGRGQLGLDGVRSYLVKNRWNISKIILYSCHPPPHKSKYAKWIYTITLKKRSSPCKTCHTPLFTSSHLSVVNVKYNIYMIHNNDMRWK